MPATLVKGWAKKYNIPTATIEKYWKRAKAIAFKQYGKDATKAYQTVVGKILPAMLKKHTGKKVGKEDIEYFKLFKTVDEAKETKPMFIFNMDKANVVAVYDSPKEDTIPVRLGITTFRKEVEFLPFDETILDELANRLAEKYGGSIIVKKKCPGSKIKSKGKGRGAGVGKGKGPIGVPIDNKTKKEVEDIDVDIDTFTIIKTTDDFDEVAKCFRILAASQVFESVPSYEQQIMERYTYTDNYKWDDYGEMLSPFYINMAKDFFNPIIEAFALTAVRGVINARRNIFPEEVSQLRSLMYRNDDALTEFMTARLDGLEIPKWYYDQLDKAFSLKRPNAQPIEVYDKKVAKLTMLYQKSPGVFTKRLLNFYSSRDADIFLEYLNKKPGHQRTKTQIYIQFLEDIGAVCAHLSDEVFFFIEKIKARLYMLSDDFPMDEFGFGGDDTKTKTNTDTPTKGVSIA